ncbi:hypothetical protein PIB30_035598 [Stylosanthes scabra]|uniref:Uncharacterized protein n=1 Tax=Stylosanthes scabra TaxID=79078 RepID=A0ABU6WE21_9FABA|nr:hypothetical protein [Stylosanthes scabra]
MRVDSLKNGRTRQAPTDICKDREFRGVPTQEQNLRIDSSKNVTSSVNSGGFNDDGGGCFAERRRLCNTEVTEQATVMAPYSSAMAESWSETVATRTCNGGDD